MPSPLEKNESKASGQSDALLISDLSQHQRQQIAAFAELLVQENRSYNLTRITDTDEILLKHFQDCLVCVPRIRQLQQSLEHCNLIDIGSGAGLPAIALAIALPDWQVISVESTGKKAQFQLIAMDELCLNNFQVLNMRAEIMAHHAQYREKFAVATTRALARTNMLAELCLPFVQIGGELLAWKGPRLDEELPEAQKAVKQLGGRIETQIRYNLADYAEPLGMQGAEDTDSRLLVIKKTAPTDSRYPRPYSEIKHKSLG